ncbi:conserved hypothetical protein [Mesorhizobium metallidurans STM 2683]|uniref:Uncharacterized protein n=1 Tax=Mesorhizobium metallidurans STM 2683 TaxID=1297569 RepID=M5EPN8_9HYPH|nr:conserved hypothetical protein [Mesorhizobium metallidurans STM 2683]
MANRNSMVARNILHEELGYFSDVQTSYSLDEETRDRLIAHGRQDAAHALTNTIALMESQASRRWTNRLLLIAVALLVYIAYRVTT